ncbi:adenylate/guanylate cyclase domain-containing protein [bacterium]|nr:adenylate/guanylate cyclase domain-containing protein [bacterium]
MAAMSMGFRSWKLPAKIFSGCPQGFVNLILDPDERIRRYPPYMLRERMENVSTASGIKRVLVNRPEECLAIVGLKIGEVASGGYPIPPKIEREISFQYFAQVDPRAIASETLDFATVLLSSSTSIPPNQETLESKVKDRIVFIGPTASEFHDVFFTSFSGKDQKENPVPGVFIHAMIANSILENHVIKRVSLRTEQIIAGLFLFGSVTLVWIFSPIKGLALFALIALGYAGSGFLLFSRSLLWFPIASPLLSAIGALIPNLALRVLVSEQKHAVIKKLFSAYVSPKVLTYVQQRPDLLKLEGERREATVFFSDLKGFTTISETMPAERLSQVMNDYLTPMTEIIMEHEGYLDKYIGDAIMAVFGIPMEDPKHALHACQAAVRQKRRLVQVAQIIEREANVKISARMGVNSGIVCAGNMGSKERFQYTVMGDIVNQASRFEGANKIFGSSIMMGESTFLAVRKDVFARLLAHLTVKGKTEAVVVYELIDLREGLSIEESAKLEEFCALFDAAMALFIAGNLDSAKAGFLAFKEKFPDDGPAAFYLDRCMEIISEGVPTGFLGVVKLDSK